MTQVLIVDDDLALADVLAFTLRRAGYTVALAHDGPAALEVFDREQPDLVVLDWGLPGLDGLEVCQRLRATSRVPILMLTVRKTDDDVVKALEAGADEYVTKPFSPRQLVARVNALVRRAAGEPEGTLQVGALTLDLARHEARWPDAQPIRLSPLEMRLLQSLMRHAGHVLPAETLIARVWGPEGATRDMLKQLVYRLRSKLEPDPAAPQLIENIPNVGYVMHTPDDPLSSA